MSRQTASTPNSSKVAVIGLDGAAWESINALIKRGELPNIQDVMQRGTYSVLKSTIPPLTGPAWVSFATGKNPGKHGIFDFFVTDDDLSSRRYISRSDVSGDMFYEILVRHGKRCIIVNLPCSSPPRIDGIVIDSFTAKGQNYIFPDDLPNHIPLLQKYRIVPEGATENLAEFREIERIRFDCTRELLLRREWDFLFVLFLLSDAVHHKFYDQIIDGTLTDSEAISAWRDLDEYVGWFANNLPNDTTLLIMSDHGFAAEKKKFAINRWLMESEYLKPKAAKHAAIEPSGVRIPNFLLTHSNVLKIVSLPYRLLRKFVEINPTVLDIDPDMDQSVAYAMWTMAGPVAGIFINTTDRFKHGIVPPSDYEQLRTKLIDELKDLKDSSGRSVLRYALRKEEVYWGGRLDRAPDILVGSDEYNITMRGLPVISEWRGGRNMHAREGILIAYGLGVNHERKTNDASIFDLAPTILHLFGLKVPQDMDGRVLKEILADSAA